MLIVDDHAIERLVGQGLANSRIARRSRISERTVEAPLTGILRRVNVPDRAQAAPWAQQHLHR